MRRSGAYRLLRGLDQSTERCAVQGNQASGVKFPADAKRPARGEAGRAVMEDG
jgi:hypothetical protein